LDREALLKSANRLIGIVAVLATTLPTSAITSTEDHIAWVEHCLNNFVAIKPGMTRQEIEKRLGTGRFFNALVTFTHTDCTYFKIDVDFDVPWGQPPLQNIMIMSPSDRAKTVSNPYIQRSNVDALSPTTSTVPETGLQKERSAWVEKCLADFESIKPGMTRREVEKRLRQDGGPSIGLDSRFVHSDCPYFKVDIEFVMKTDNSLPTGPVSPDDLVSKVSIPYLQNPVMD
jgi:outer membrane protein assembly factor BamE (lipoprotein component of BamABCDE complex)